MRVTFHGVRGSTPSPCPENQGYGGNTSCVSVEVEGHQPVILDLGTGLRRLGHALGETFEGTMFVSHLHWDHIQGLPFFTPLQQAAARARIFGPAQDSGTFREALERFIRPPYFPVTLTAFPCRVEVSDLDGASGQSVTLGEIEVTAGHIPHCGPTNGYRIDCRGRSVAYVPDHQQPRDDQVADSVLELCGGVDLLIHDSQYTDEEFSCRSDWGHCTVEYAVSVAVRCGVRRLALFHHDPAHDDAIVDELVESAVSCASRFGVEVFAAREGDTVEVV